MQTYSNIAFESLLFIKTSHQIDQRLELYFLTHKTHTTLTLSKLMKHILKSHHKHSYTQKELTHQHLGIHHLTPIYISPQLILCPLQSHRAPIQYIINMSHVIGMSSQKSDTIIVFKQNHRITVPYPLTVCLKQWKAAQILSQVPDI
ncbi:hypothetical protein C7J88_03540 [Staphylococcus muscae]|uniref:ComK family protein n=1 Tax=Staphylococcus muscae TaxID=1294 RepID=A0A240C4G7_9STAP|nr:competence protein ComK [Staphylococcus muscae]AVQ33317.1 hypothetical protein C7J88_03540 [Staphylococcus muscae]PNZ01927.1 hypothetical protein CD131_08620 [Staphylococcus muscae]GGA94636.1 hypothetical protein GCM10007183_18510 [Staphylococcus muscae]SNW03001.1 comK family protein [Staphylococcus muscae]